MSRQRLTQAERQRLALIRNQPLKEPPWTNLYGKERMPKETAKYGSAIVGGIALILIILAIYALREVRFPTLPSIWTLDFWAPMRSP